MIETIIISIVGLIVSIIVGVNAMLNNKRTHQREEDRRKDEKEQKDRARQKNRPQFKLVSVKKNLNEFEYFKDKNLDFDVLFLPYSYLDCDTDNYTPLYDDKNPERYIVKGKNSNKKPICKYVNIYDKKSEWVNVTMEYENVGHSSIEMFYLLNMCEKQGSIINIMTDEDYETLQLCQGCDHVVTPQRNRNNPGDKIKIRVNFHKNYVENKNYILALYMQTEYKEFWCQYIYVGEREEDKSFLIDSKEYSDYYRGEYLDAVMYDRVYWSKINRGENN